MALDRLILLYFGRLAEVEERSEVKLEATEVVNRSGCCHGVREDSDTSESECFSCDVQTSSDEGQLEDVEQVGVVLEYRFACAKKIWSHELSSGILWVELWLV